MVQRRTQSERSAVTRRNILRATGDIFISDASAPRGRDGRQAIATFVSGAAAILRRTAPLEAVVQTTSPTEPVLQEAHERGEQLRAQGYRRFVDTLSQRGLLREDTDPGEAADVLLSIVGPHMYATLTTDRGWNHQRFVDWASRSVPDLLL